MLVRGRRAFQAYYKLGQLGCERRESQHDMPCLLPSQLSHLFPKRRRTKLRCAQAEHLQKATCAALYLAPLAVHICKQSNQILSSLEVVLYPMSRSRGSTLISRVLQRGSGVCSCSYSPSVAESIPALHSSFSTSTARTVPGLPAILTQLRLEAARCRQTFAIRALSGQAGTGRAFAGSAREQHQAERAVVSKKDTFDEITDKHIPQRPMGVVEGTSYSLVILAAIGFGIALLWTAVSSLLIQPKEYTCFNVTLDKLRDDPRVTVRLGTPISGYGQESRNRAARQRIPHRAYNDDSGTEHFQVQFHAKGPTGAALISADMYQDAAKQWQYAFLFVDVTNPTPQRLVLIGPQY